MDCTIRPMTPDDLPLLAAWMVELPLLQRYRQTYEDAVAKFEAALARGDWLIVADADVAAIGFAWAIPRAAFGRSPYLRLIAVRADRVGSEIGARLLAEIERIAAIGSSDLFLLTSDFNEAAQRFYRRHGYEHIGAIPGYVLPDVTEMIFRKRLK